MKAQKSSGDNNHYFILNYSGENFEFCQEGTIKVGLYRSDFSEGYANFPSLEDLELFYIHSNSIYMPVFNNARLL